MQKMTSEKLMDILSQSNFEQKGEAEEFQSFAHNETLDFQVDSKLLSARNLNMDEDMNDSCKVDRKLDFDQKYQNKGILFYSLNDLFNLVKERKLLGVYIIRCSYFEIYNDSIYDLLKEN